LAVLAIASGQTASGDKPNIIFMMADDLGYHDLSCYGQKAFPTPNTDRLARQGIRLTSAYSPSAVCSPTRYAVLTGTDPFRRYLTSHVLFNAEPLVIRPHEPTVASRLKAVGYATGVVGKWHLGLGDRLPRDLNDPGRGPNEVGFDESFLVPDGHNMFPSVYHENGNVVGGTDPKFESRLQVLDRLGFKLLQHAPRDTWPERRPVREIGATLADKVDAFLEQHKDQRFFLYYPTCSIHHPFKPDARFEGKSGIGPHGDFVMEFDWAVGRVMDKLDQLGLAENTLFMVTSDNGGLAPVNSHRPSAPWRGMKGSEYEGGHRVPFIARWPGRIPADAVSDEWISLVDVFATAAGLAGATLPPAAARDSFDMMPVLLGGDAVRPYVVTGTRGMTRMALRQGDWKLVCDPPDRQSAELYNLTKDPEEKHDEAAAHPGKASELWTRLQDYANRGSSRPGALEIPAPFDQIFAQKTGRNAMIAEMQGSE
jgi:arylsulfatase A-like enzyme